MMKIFNYIILCFLLGAMQTSYAQLYEGSNGDGFDYAMSIKNTLGGQSITVLFNGGNGDGFALAESIKNTLGGQSLTVLFNGGNGDGFALEESIKNTLGGQSITVLFNGGNGDGFALEESIKNTLGGQSITVLFNGGNGDGFALEESIKNTLGGQSITVLFNGGNGDGFALEESIKNTLGGQSITVLFNGGNGDGFAVTQETLFLIAQVKADIIAFLQGPLLLPATPGLMNDILREDNLLPTTSPYSDGLTVNPIVFNTTGNDAIVDWIWVELRDDTNVNNVISSRSALMQRDGDIVDLDGISNISMEAAPKAYYVAVKHRNHLGVMSANPITLSPTATTIDFTQKTFPTFGSNAQVALNTGDTAMWAGDVNGNNQTRYLGPSNDTNSIKDNVLNPINGNPSNSNFYFYTKYDNADVNMNGVIRYLGPSNDTSILKDIILSHPSNSTNSNFFIITSQAPN